MNMSSAITVIGLALFAKSHDDESLKAQAKSALEATGFTFGTMPSGKNYSILFDHPENRKQTVYMNVSPNRPGTLVTYNFYTTVWVGKDAPDEALMRTVLTKIKKLGAFYLFKDSKDVWAIRFNVKFDATEMPESPKSEDLQVKTLKDIVYFVNAVGEEMDKELNGDKDIP